MLFTTVKCLAVTSGTVAGGIATTALLAQADAVGPDVVKNLVTTSPVLATLALIVFLFLKFLDRERDRQVEAAKLAWAEVGAIRTAWIQQTIEVGKQAVETGKLASAVDSLCEKVGK